LKGGSFSPTLARLKKPQQLVHRLRRMTSFEMTPPNQIGRIEDSNGANGKMLKS
jgi:hypothetical protein